MTVSSTAQSAHSEWDYRYVESRFKSEKTATSIPCQLSFTETPFQDTDRFHAALEEQGYSPLDVNPTRTIAGRIGEGNTPHYDGEIYSHEHHLRVRIYVSRGGYVRLFPHDNYVPTVEELANILNALRAGFDADLKHNPIEK